MICDLTIPGSPDEIVNLAGGGSPSSEVSGLSIGTRGNAQKVDHIGAEESRQFMRGGSLTDVSFTSSREFESRAAAQDWLFALQATLATAGNAQCEALLATRSNAATITGTLSPDATAVSPVPETFLNSNFYDSGASYPRVTLQSDGTNAWLAYYADASAYTSAWPSGIWKSSTAGSDPLDPTAFTSWAPDLGLSAPALFTTYKRWDVTFSGTPNEGETIELDLDAVSDVYTLTATPSSAGDIDRNLSAAALSDALENEINGDGIGPASTIVTASSDEAGTVTITAITSGTTGAFDLTVFSGSGAITDSEDPEIATGTPTVAKSTTDANSLTLYDVSANVNGSAIGRTVMLNVSLIGRNDDPSS